MSGSPWSEESFGTCSTASSIARFTPRAGFGITHPSQAKNATFRYPNVEKKPNSGGRETAPQVTARVFSSGSDSREAPANTKSETLPGITIQIRMKTPPGHAPGRLLTRKNTEFWVTANDNSAPS
jgi:hypothetical protein